MALPSLTSTAQIPELCSYVGHVHEARTPMFRTRTELAAHKNERGTRGGSVP